MGLTQEEITMTFKLKENVSENSKYIPSCASGEVIRLEMIKDNIFSSKILGEGYGVVPSEKEITAPFKCSVRDITNGGQSLTLRCENGLQILIHIGIDLPEKNFSAENNRLYKLSVSTGDVLSAGDILGEIDFESALEQGFDPTVVLIITNSDEIKDFTVLLGKKSCGDNAAKYFLK